MQLDPVNNEDHTACHAVGVSQAGTRPPAKSYEARLLRIRSPWDRLSSPKLMRGGAKT